MSVKTYLKQDIGLSDFECTEVLSKAGQAAAKEQTVGRVALRMTLAILAGLVALAIARVIIKAASLNIPPAVVTAATGAVLGGAVAGALMAHRVRPFVYAELRARGHDVCLECGYLRDGVEPDAACPECGTAARPLEARA